MADNYERVQNVNKKTWIYEIFDAIFKQKLVDFKTFLLLSFNSWKIEDLKFLPWECQKDDQLKGRRSLENRE